MSAEARDNAAMSRRCKQAKEKPDAWRAPKRLGRVGARMRFSQSVPVRLSKRQRKRSRASDGRATLVGCCTSLSDEELLAAIYRRNRGRRARGLRPKVVTEL